MNSSKSRFRAITDFLGCAAAAAPPPLFCDLLILHKPRVPRPVWIRKPGNGGPDASNF
jgi:hypothetical protein